MRDIQAKITRGIIGIVFLVLLVGAGLALDAIDSDRRVIPSTSYTASPVQLIFQGQTYGLWPAEISWAEDGTPTYIYRPFDANTECSIAGK